MRNLLISALIILFILPSCKWIREKGWFGSDRDTLEVYQRQRDSIRVADSIKRAHEAELERIRQRAIADSLARVEERKRLEAQFPYHIIVGSFITPEYAVEYADYYQSMGYQTKIYPDVEGFDLVSAMELKDWTEAMKQLERFQDTVEFEAWIYIYPRVE
jgi:hypothetical protein